MGDKGLVACIRQEKRGTNMNLPSKKLCQKAGGKDGIAKRERERESRKEGR